MKNFCFTISSIGTNLWSSLSCRKQSLHLLIKSAQLSSSSAAVAIVNFKIDFCVMFVLIWFLDSVSLSLSVDIFCGRCLHVLCTAVSFRKNKFSQDYLIILQSVAVIESSHRQNIAKSTSWKTTRKVTNSFTRCDHLKNGKTTIFAEFQNLCLLSQFLMIRQFHHRDTMWIKCKNSSICRGRRWEICIWWKWVQFSILFE